MIKKVNNEEVCKKGYNFAIGDDIRTLRSPKSKWYHKAGAAASIASNFIPGAAGAKYGAKIAKGVKVKKLKKFNAPSVKKQRTVKVKAAKVKKYRESRSVNEGVYQFIDQTNGKIYIGQSKDIKKRLKKHAKDKRYVPGSALLLIEVKGGKTAREIVEHKRIQKVTGGVPARNSEKVSNKKDPIGPNRQHLLKKKKKKK